MSKHVWPALCLLLALALTGVALAQPARPAPVPDPSVLSGGDIGFRVEYFEGRKPVGTLVVRVNGVWIEPKTAPEIQLLRPK
jgi:hypothetical protein